MVCINGKKVSKPNGNVLFICFHDGMYKNKQCPFAKICIKIMDYKMVDKIDCQYFMPK